MKLKMLLKKVEKDLVEEKEKEALKLLTKSLKDLACAKKIIRNLETEHNKLIEKDIEDIEVTDYEY